MSTSVSAASRVQQIHANSRRLLDMLDEVVAIESTGQHLMLLGEVRRLSGLLPCGARDSVDLMRNHASALDSFASDTFAMLLTGIVKKFHQADDEDVAELVRLASITDNVDFILEAMNVLSDPSVLAGSPQLVLKILEEILMDESYLMFAFSRLSHSQLDEIQFDRYLNQLVNLPDRIANQMGREFPRTFERRAFSSILMMNAIKSLFVVARINALEQLEVYNTNFLSKLISKVLVQYKSEETVLLCSLRVMSSLAAQKTYRKAVRDLMGGLQRPAVEIAAQLIFSGVEKKERIVGMLGDVWSARSDWKFVLSRKIPFLSFSRDDRIIDNLSFFMATQDVRLMEQMLKDLTSVWSTKSHIFDAPFEQHFQVSKFIVLLTKYLTSPRDHSEEIKKLLYDGIQIHLGSTDRKLRALGMITSEVTIGIFDGDVSDDERLKFDYSDFDPEIIKEIVDVIQEFPAKAVAADILEVDEADDGSEVELMEQLAAMVEQQEIRRVNVERTKEVVEVKETPAAVHPQEVLDSDDDDDDLQPYADSDAPFIDQKCPRYLLDVIQAFTIKENAEDPEKFQLTMEAAEGIIKQQLPGHHTDLAVDLLSIFIRLDRTSFVENFEDLKMKILVQICLIHPKVSAEFLAGEFNTKARQYTITRRMLMLDVLAETAKELSKLKYESDVVEATEVNASRAQNKLLIKLNEELENRNKKDAQRIIRNRLLAKTRRITTRTKAPDENAGVNHFAAVAGSFFFPLVHGFGRKQILFTSGAKLESDSDNILLEKFLNTISVLMLCAENSLAAPKMARELLSLSVFLRYHVESKIRLAVLHSVATILLAVPQKVLANEFSKEILEFSTHLEMISTSSVENFEADRECRDFAKQLLEMFQNAL